MNKLGMLAAAAGVLLASPLLLSAQAPGSLESDLKYGREYMDANNPSAAAIHFRQAVMKHPDNAEANLLLAIALHKAGNSAEARPFYDKAIALQPGWAANADVQKLARMLDAPAAARVATPATAAVPLSVNDPNAPIGSAAYLLNYARDFLREGNFEGAADYARQVLGVEPRNAEASRILAAAKERQAPDDAPAAVRGPGGDPDRIGSPAYLLKFAQYHFDNKAYGAAVRYAKEALAIDPNFAQAKAMLDKASKLADRTPAPKPGSCQARFSSCWSGATTYVAGTGIIADPMRRQQCFVERNICQGAR